MATWHGFECTAWAGADWFCTHCGAGNKGDGYKCSSCNAMHQGMKLPGDLSKSRADEEMPLGHYQTSASGSALGLGLVAGFAVIATAACAGFAFWALQTHEDEGKVVEMTWEQATLLQRWTNTSIREWRHKTMERAEVPPVGGSGERSGKEIIFGSCRDEHWDDEKYACGTKKECTPKTKQVRAGETCHDNANGFATCSPKYKTVPDGQTCRDVTKYCSRPIFRDRCDYKVQVWKTVDTSATKGTGGKTIWPEVNVGPRDRLRFNALYGVVIEYRDDGEVERYEMNPAPDTLLPLALARRELDVSEALAAEKAYTAWSMGEVVTLDVNNLGSVSLVKHGGIQVETAE